jgi:Glycosyl transferase family 2
MRQLSYVLPLRGAVPLEGEALSYLGWLARQVDQVIVVDGSPRTAFDRNAEALQLLGVEHLRAEMDRGSSNGKVIGVHRGISAARNASVIVADDDVRYDVEALEEIASRLDRADLVWPQNHFWPKPWHARWDTSRSLMNRAFGFDFPGTVGLRREAFVASGGYRCDVLFENLQLLRTFVASGRTVDIARDVYVRRLPPTATRFFSQRVRQAYDSFATPGRFAAELAIVPLLIHWGRGGRWRRIGAAAAAAISVADRGRRRDGGRCVFAGTDPLWAPLWLLERGVCAWVALLRFSTGGMPYAGAKLKVAATRPRRGTFEERHGWVNARPCAHQSRPETQRPATRTSGRSQMR